MECQNNRCPLCWYDGIDTIVEEGHEYCHEHEEQA